MIKPEKLLIDMDKATRGVAVTDDLGITLPNLAADFEQVDAQYAQDPEQYLGVLEQSVSKLDRVNDFGETITYSLLADDRVSSSDEIFVTFAPFADGAPQTTAKQLHTYLQEEEPGITAKQQAQPNTWNQITKSAVVYELLIAQGRGMPVVTIFNPIPPRVYMPADRAAIRQGDFTPAGRVVEAVIDEAQYLLHGSAAVRAPKIHLHGASLGAHNAIGAAAFINRSAMSDLEVKTVTAQELIMGPSSLPELMKRFMLKQYVERPTAEQPPIASAWIPEPAIRRAIDGNGSEPTTLIRTAKAMSKLMYLRGLTRPLKLREDIGWLLFDEIPVTVANAHDSSLTEATESYLSNYHGRIKLLDMLAQEDQQAGHLVNEHVGVLATVAALGVHR